MNNIWIIFKREMMAYFYSPIAYVVSVCMLLLMGLQFYLILEILVQQATTEYAAMVYFFNGFFMWLVILLVPPVLTMRLFADEKRMGTIESLMTTPLRDIEYVLGKFLAGYFLFVLIFVPTFNYPFVLQYFSKNQVPLDLGVIIGGYTGVFLIGMLMVAMGCLASASTKNQIISAILSVSMGMGLLCVGLLYYYVQGDVKNVFESFTLVLHLQEMATGIIDWRRVVFYLTTSMGLLFITLQMVQSRRWKS